MRHAVLATGAVLALLVPAVAIAGSSNLGTVGGLTYTSDFAATDGPFDEATGSARCPAGTHVVGGGARLPWDGFHAHLNGLYPKDGQDGDRAPDDSFALRAWRDDAGTAPQAADVFAVCRSGDVAYRHASKKVAAGHGGVVKAECPNGRHVSGGGVRIAGKAKQAFLNSSNPFDGPDDNPAADDGWQARVYNLSGGAKRVTAHAFCGRRNYEYLRGGNAFGGFPTRDTATVCSDGHLAAPGVQLSGSAGNARPSAVYPRDSQVFHTDPDSIPDDETAASGANLGPSDKVIYAWAVCTT